jgi:hypothetical protein
LFLLVVVMERQIPALVEFPEHLVVLVVVVLVVHLLLEALGIHQQLHQAKAITAALVRLALLTMVLVAGVGQERLDLQGQQLLVGMVV